MITPPDSLKKIKHSFQELASYSGMDTGCALVYEPSDCAQLKQIFAFATANGRQLTLRAGGHSFDSQALGRDLVVSMCRFNTITVQQDTQEVCVGAGATWGEIVRKLEPCGLVPAGTVTSSHATAGGTLASDCLSRFAPSCGKEGTWVKEFSLMKLGGDVITCERPPPGTPADQLTEEHRVFAGAIGGFGYVGAIVAITYRVLRVGDGSTGIGVKTRVKKFKTFEGLSGSLVSSTMPTYYSQPPGPGALAQREAIYAGLYPRGQNAPSALVFTSTFTTTCERRRLLLNQPNLKIRVLVEWLMRRPRLCAFFSWIYFAMLTEDRPYIDDLEGFMFFMDGNTRAKRIAERFGFDQRTIQQTFVVPIDHHPGGSGDATDALTRWLGRAHELFCRFEIVPTLQDVLFLPADPAFYLSPSRQPGFAVSYAFETSDEATLTLAEQAFTELAAILWAEFHGRVSLVKNVHADQSTLVAMYGADVSRFLVLKNDLDPKGILQNDFFKRTFGTTP